MRLKAQDFTKPYTLINTQKYSYNDFTNVLTDFAFKSTIPTSVGYDTYYYYTRYYSTRFYTRIWKGTSKCG